ncbi:MAG TPA: hypothetical protein VJQ78_09715, partial [Sphingobium sp.]|nr:hypothetical protein [Sphingobium sp.]
QTLRLGDTSVDIIPTPGHTPGTLSLIFPVKDGKQVHRAAIWGGTGFNSRTEEQFTTYAASAEMFAKLVKAAKVDVPLSNHPIVDHSFAKIEALQKRTAGQTHPFATGPASQQNLLTVGAQCAYASRLSAAAASSSAETAPPASAR